jgi:hypothetical protein
MTPQTEAEWKQAIFAAGPDRGGDTEAFRCLLDARQVWRAQQPRLCQWCGVRPIPARNDDRRRPLGRFCGQTCANRATNSVKRKPRRLHG